MSHGMRIRKARDALRFDGIFWTLIAGKVKRSITRRAQEWKIVWAQRKDTGTRGRKGCLIAVTNTQSIEIENMQGGIEK